MIGPPHFAPDGRSLIAVNAAPKGGDTVSGIEVWSLAGPAPELVFYRPAHLEEGFSFVDWAGDRIPRLNVQTHQRAPRAATLYFPNGRSLLSRPPCSGFQLLRLRSCAARRPSTPRDVTTCR